MVYGTEMRVAEQLIKLTLSKYERIDRTVL